MSNEYSGGSGNFHSQPPWKPAAPGQNETGRGNVKCKSQTGPELSWREGSNTDEIKSRPGPRWRGAL